MTAGSVVPISVVEAIGLESVQRRQSAAQNRVYTMPSGLTLLKRGLACHTRMFTLVHPVVILALPRQGHQLTSDGIVTLNPRLATHFVWAMLKSMSLAQAFRFDHVVSFLTNTRI